MAEVVGDLQGTSAMAVAWQCGGRQRRCNGATFWARGYAVSTMGWEAEHLRRSLRNQEPLDAQGRDADGDVSESLRAFIWQPLGLRIIVKPPALREHHDWSVDDSPRGACGTKQLVRQPSVT